MFVFTREVPITGSTFSFNRIRERFARRSAHSAVFVKIHQLIREDSAHHATFKNHDVDVLSA